MRLYIMRHGPAAEGGPRYPDDRLRPLTEEGRQKTREAARGLAALADDIGAVLTSPLVRARETAEIAAEALGLEDGPRKTAALEPGFDPALLLREARATGKPGVLVVGHEPDMGLLLAWVLGGRKRVAISVPFKKAAVACVDAGGVEGDPASLEWFATPAILRAVGRAK